MPTSEPSPLALLTEPALLNADTPLDRSLHRKKNDLQGQVRHLQARVHELEDALREAKRRTEGCSTPANDEQHSETAAEVNEIAEDVFDAFGSLTIGEKGEVAYYGVSSSTEVRAFSTFSRY